MPISDDATAKLLMAAIHEDRTEIRLIKDRIYANTTLITTASFAITPFLMERAPPPSKLIWLALTDGAFLLMLWVLFIGLVSHVNLGQRYMETREGKLHALQTGQASAQELLVFGPDVIPRRAGIRHGAVYWMTHLATLVILAKLAVAALIVDGSLFPQLLAR